MFFFFFFFFRVLLHYLFGLSWFHFVYSCHLTCMILEGVGMFPCFSCVLFQIFKDLVMTGIHGVDRCDWIYKYYEHHLIFHPVKWLKPPY